MWTYPSTAAPTRRCGSLLWYHIRNLIDGVRNAPDKPPLVSNTRRARSGAGGDPWHRARRWVPPVRVPAGRGVEVDGVGEELTRRCGPRSRGAAQDSGRVPRSTVL